jgi:hypothetical protein
MQDFCEPEVESGYAEKEEGEWQVSEVTKKRMFLRSAARSQYNIAVSPSGMRASLRRGYGGGRRRARIAALECTTQRRMVTMLKTELMAVFRNE